MVNFDNNLTRRAVFDKYRAGGLGDSQVVLNILMCVGGGGTGPQNLSN